MSTVFGSYYLPVTPKTLYTGILVKRVYCSQKSK